MESRVIIRALPKAAKPPRQRCALIFELLQSPQDLPIARLPPPPPLYFHEFTDEITSDSTMKAKNGRKAVAPANA